MTCCTKWRTITRHNIEHDYSNEQQQQTSGTHQKVPGVLRPLCAELQETGRQGGHDVLQEVPPRRELLLLADPAGPVRLSVQDAALKNNNDEEGFVTDS